jgi:hypothetical protein
MQAFTCMSTFSDSPRGLPAAGELRRAAATKKRAAPAGAALPLPCRNRFAVSDHFFCRKNSTRRFFHRSAKSLSGTI